MNKFFKDLWINIRSNGETLGFLFLLLGVLVLITQVYLIVQDPQNASDFTGIWLGLFSVGLGFIAIGMAARSDKRHTQLLERLDKNLARLPTMFNNDILTPSGQLLAKKMLNEQSKEAAQKRLDDDIKKVGYVRGEIFQLEDGSWAVHWGGKYPL